MLERREAGAPLHLRCDAGGTEALTLDLPPVVTRPLLDLLTETAAGHAVTLVQVEAELTTQQAGGLLNVSRPFLVGVIDKGVLPARMVGHQRRLHVKEVFAFKADRVAKRGKVLDQLVAYDQELGLECRARLTAIERVCRAWPDLDWTPERSCSGGGPTPSTDDRRLLRLRWFDEKTSI